MVTNGFIGGKGECDRVVLGEGERGDRTLIHIQKTWPQISDFLLEVGDLGVTSRKLQLRLASQD